MSAIDMMLVGGVLIVSAWRILAPAREPRALIWAPGILVILAAIQLALEGYYWQLLPAYVLIVVASLPPPQPDAPRGVVGKLGRYLGLAGVWAVMAVSLGFWVFLPVPRMTAPEGPYRIGTEVFRWVDAGRAEPTSANPGDRRNVIVQAWYPADPGTDGPHAVYMDGLGYLPPMVTMLPRFLFAHFDRINSQGVLGAAVAGRQPKWPVVLFSPGYGAPRAVYTSLITGLASKGYVVLAIDHPYEAAITVLADGRPATTVERFAPTDPDRVAFMTGRLEVRVADLRFALDQIGRPGVLPPALAEHLDLGQVAAIGHSLGGATAVAAMADDPRIKAAVNIDGTPYGDMVAAKLDRPFMLLQSDYAETRHSKQFLEGNAALLANDPAPSYRYEIKRANHYSFTDAPLFFSMPGRFLLARFIGGERGPRQTQRATIDLVSAFLQAPLGGQPAELQKIAVGYPNIVGGPVKR